MSLFIPTYEEIQVSKRLRSEIIDCILDIQKVEELKIILGIAKEYQKSGIRECVMSLYEFVAFLDPPTQTKLLNLFENEPSGLLASDQIKELLSKSLKEYFN